MNALGSGGMRLIGKRITRKEDGRLLTGHGQYTDDVRLPGMLHAAFTRSSVARGRIDCAASGIQSLPHVPRQRQRR